ncbi:MAG: hypothetical protein D6794_04595 [Deltaproteobacteria bacterium]|nr:MAG: hypothetical protein D6794_04595 [Deltaproteobacteria bacterium]
MHQGQPAIPPMFLSRFQVDERAPFVRHLNRLEVEIGREDYRHLKRVERLPRALTAAEKSGLIDLTGRLLSTTQNDYNRRLLQRLGIQVLLDARRYRVYYCMRGQTIRFDAVWRERVLDRFFGRVPLDRTGWQDCGSSLPDFEVRYEPDDAGGALLFRRQGGDAAGDRLLTAPHGPYDPHTLEVALYFLRSGKAGAAVINLGFAGREPLTDSNLERLKSWGVPLNPSNIDVIYPYLDERGYPCSYKTERALPDYLAVLGMAAPAVILDIHGCVGTCPEDRKVVVGLGGMPPWPVPDGVGRLEPHGEILHLFPNQRLREGLELVRELSEEVFVQFCSDPQTCYNFVLLGGLQAVGRRINPKQDTQSLIEGEERSFLPAERVRWLPGAGANALQRSRVADLPGPPLVLHVEIPTAIRRNMALRLAEMAIFDSLDSSGL